MPPFHRSLTLLLAVPIVSNLLVSNLFAAGPLTPEELRGRQIYLEGTSPSGDKITALMGDEAVEVPASAVPCAGCHGRDGRGRPEGGVSPSDLTWDTLTRPYGVTHPSGRRSPPYDERLLKRAVTMGLDSAGTKLHVAMPRFRLSLQDMADLTAYIKRLGNTSDPGVTGAAVRIGLVLPPPGSLTPMGKSVQAALAARLADWNGQGGIYGRKIELVPFEPPADPAARYTAVAGFLAKGDVFAHLGAFLLGDDTALADLFGKAETPLIGPFTVHPRETLPLDRQVFYLLPGIEAQGRASARALRSTGSPVPPHPAILAPDEAGLNDAVAAVVAAWPEAQPTRYERGRFDPAALAHRLSAAGADPVLFLGSGAEALALLRAADGIGWHPRLAATAAAGDGSLFQAPPAFAGRLWLALPSSPGPSELAMRDYLALAQAHHLSQENLSAQLTALAAAEILGEALKRAGRDLTRDRLIEQFETLRTFQTGYAPPITYSPTRRLGARGAYVFQLDLAGRKLGAGGWVDGD
jgi:ABC-type branched-subunit amino acid transport system substrate-binding protein